MGSLAIQAIFYTIPLMTLFRRLPYKEEMLGITKQKACLVLIRQSSLQNFTLLTFYQLMRLAACNSRFTRAAVSARVKLD